MKTADKAGAVVEPLVVCDVCEEQWEKSFICEKCSGLVLETDYGPDPMWDYDDRESDCIEREVHVHRDVCLNCCNCQ